MRLVTHNLLKCNIRNVENGYPLKILLEKLEIISMEYNPGREVHHHTMYHIHTISSEVHVCNFLLFIELVQKMLKRINWSALKTAAIDLSIENTFNALHIIDPSLFHDESFLRYIHHLLFEVHILEGWLECPETGRKFPIKDGIPNMLLHEDEIWFKFLTTKTNRIRRKQQKSLFTRSFDRVITYVIIISSCGRLTAATAACGRFHWRSARARTRRCAGNLQR